MRHKNSTNGKHCNQNQQIETTPKRNTKLNNAKLKKVLAICLIALFIANINNIFAYLTSQDSTSNHFSIGTYYTVTFHANNGTDDTITQQIFYNQTTNLNFNTFTKEGHSFSKWTINPDGTGTSYTDGQSVSNLTTPLITNINLYAQWIEGTAEINGTLYNTLQGAINAVPSNNTETTVKLLKDVSENITINANKNVNLNLQHFTVSNTSTNAAVITNKGTLKISNGILTSSSQTAVINNEQTGTLIISGGQILATGNRQAIYNNKGTLEITGTAYINSKTSQRAAMINLAGGTATITGGTIISEGQAAVENAGTMTIGIKDGNIDKTTPTLQGATNGLTATTNVNLYNGTIKGKTTAISNENKIVDIEEGYEIVHGLEKINGTSYDTAYLGTSITITFNATGGSLSPNYKKIEQGTPIGVLPEPTRTGYTFEGWFTEEEEGDKITEDTIVSLETTYYAHWSKNTVAEINGVEYSSLEEAIAVVPKDNTPTIIKLLANTKESVTVAKNQNIIFDLQNFKMTSNGNHSVIDNEGTLSISNGTITSNADTATINNKPTGKLTISGGQILSTGTRQALYNENGTVEITGTAYLSSTATGAPTPGAHATLGRATVQNLQNGTITITGGTIIGINQQAISNEGKLTLGTQIDGIVNSSSPTIQGNTYGIITTKTLNFYDGIIKGITDPIDGSITEIDPNATQQTSTETINETTYKTTYLE